MVGWAVTEASQIFFQDILRIRRFFYSVFYSSLISLGGGRCPFYPKDSSLWDKRYFRKY